jgi:hypothetical protein
MDDSASVVEGFGDAAVMYGSMAILGYVTTELCIASAFIGAIGIVLPVGGFCILNLRATISVHPSSRPGKTLWPGSTPW